MLSPRPRGEISLIARVVRAKPRGDLLYRIGFDIQDISSRDRRTLNDALRLLAEMASPHPSGRMA